MSSSKCSDGFESSMFNTLEKEIESEVLDEDLNNYAFEGSLQ